jgi:hypothetical protein
MQWMVQLISRAASYARKTFMKLATGRHTHLSESVSTVEQQMRQRQEQQRRQQQQEQQMRQRQQQQQLEEQQRRQHEEQLRRQQGPML